MTVKVLFVDDNRSQLQIFKKYLEKISPDFDVYAVDDAEVALSELDRQYFSVIVSDYQLATMDGLDLLKFAREKNPTIPYIIFTGRGQEEIAIKALNLGASHYIKKEGDPASQFEELSHVIRNLVDMRDSKEKYRAVFDHALDGILIVERDTRKGYAANPAFCEMTGYTPEDIENLSVDDIHPREDLERVLNDFEEQAQGKKKVAENLPVLRKDGTQFFADITSAPLSLGGKEYVVGFFNDVSARVAAQESLRESEERYRLIAENSSDVIFTLDMELNRTYLSPSVAELRGFSVEESMKQTWEEILTPASFERMIRFFGQQMYDLNNGVISEYPVTIELEMVHARKGTVWVETSASPIFNAEGKPIGIVGITRDISSRKEMENQLRASERLFKSLYENISDGLLHMDLNGQITFCNDKLLSMTGYTRDEVIGESFTKFLHPDTVSDAKRIFERSISKQAALASGYEGTILRKDGSSFYYHLNSSLIYDDDKVIGIQSHIRDISRRHQEEEFLLRQKEELSEYAHSMTHDLKSSIQTIITCAEMIKESERLELADDIISAATMMDSLLTKSVRLADAGMIIGDKEQVNLSDLVREAATSCLPSTVSFSTSTLPSVRCDRDKVIQVIHNIFMNAIEHGNATGIEIEMKMSKKHLSLFISNNGTPIPSKDRKRIFEEGFTTKQNGGLGLNIVKRIVEAHGWSIKLDRRKITTFVISIPVEDVVD